MTVTAVAATYRARIATRGASVVSGNVALTLAISDLADVPTLTGPSVDVLAGKSTSHPFDLECIVDTVLFLDGGRLATIGRLIEIQRSDDGGAFTTIATGRISGASEIDEKGKITLQVSDEGWAERDTEIFATTDTIQLHPPGLASAWMTFDAAGDSVYTVVEVDGDAVKLRTESIGNADALDPVPASLRESLALDMVASEDRDNSATNSAGNFDALRFEYVSDDGASNLTPGDSPVISFRQALGGGLLAGSGITSLLGQMSPEGSGQLLVAWIYFGSAHGLTVGDEVTGRYKFLDTLRVSENVPKHIGGTDGIHPGDLLEQILDGTHGGNAVIFDSAAMTAFQALSLPKVWLRITEPVDRRKWLTRHFWTAMNGMPLVGTDLQIRPTALRLDQDVDPATLTIISAADGDSRVWEHGSRNLVTALRFSSQGVRRRNDTTDRGEDWPADSLEAFRSAVPDIDHDNVSTLGRVAHEIETDLIFLPADAKATARVLAQDIFDVFGDGPSRGTIEVPDSSTIQVGDLVRIDQDTLKGFNPGTGDRTGDRIVRAIEFRERTPAKITFGYLDLGPASAPLAAPTVSIVQNGTDPDLVDVTISGLNAGETATVEVGVGAVEPTDFDFRRSGVGNETISFRVEAGDDTAWVRAFAFAPHRIRSAYASDSVVLSTRATINDATVTMIGFTRAEIRWDVPSGTGGIQSDYAIHDRNADPVWGNNVTDHDATTGGFNISGMQSSRQMVSVRLTPYPTFSGGAVSGTAGDRITVESIFRRVTGGITIRRAELTSIETTFDGSGNTIVSVRGDEEAAVVYVTVGDGAEPPDPTAAANDGSVADRTGRITTAVAVAAGNDAFVKAVSADADGVLGPVSLSQAARPVTTGGAGSGLDLTAGTLSLDIESLTLDAGPMDALDSLAFHDDGVGTRRILPDDIPVSLFNNDAGYTVGGLETASTGLTTVGTDVQAEYTGGAGSLIGAAPDGTGLGTLGTSDRILFADFGDSFNVKFADLNQLPFESGLTAGVGLGRSGDDFFVQFATEGGIVNSGDALALDIEDLHDWEAADGLAAADKIAMYDVAGDIGNKALRLDQIDLSLLDNSTSNFTANAIDSASNGLVNVGGDVQPEYGPSASNLVLAADGGLLSALAGADSILVSDASDNVVHHTSLSDLESFWSIGAAQITAGTFGAGAYTFPGGLDVLGSELSLGQAWADMPFTSLDQLEIGDGVGPWGIVGRVGSGADFGITVTDDDTNLGSRVLLDATSIRVQVPSTTRLEVSSTLVDLAVPFGAGGVERLDLDAIDSTHGRFAFQNGQVHTVEGAEITRGTVGAVTLDWDAYNSVPLRNDGNIDTINIDDGSMQPGNWYTLAIRSATGSQQNITFSASGTLKWLNGDGEPTDLSQTNGEYNIIQFLHTGSVTLAAEWHAA